MTRDETNAAHIGRRGVLAGIAGTMGAVALPAGSALAQPAHPARPSAGRPYPPNWPALEPYGLADTRKDLWPREDNSFILPLELRPRDEELGRVWMRDTYVNCFRTTRPRCGAPRTTCSPGGP